MQLSKFILIGFAALVLNGCVNVEPTERNFLAKDHMKLDPNYLDAKFDRHMYFAREGMYGGYGGDASGCGCN